jgi:hypothetical protein
MNPATSADVVLQPVADHPNGIAFTMTGEVAGKGKTTLILVPFADAGADGKSRFEVWIPVTATVAGVDSVFSGAEWAASRQGNVTDSITDDDTSTYAVTFNEAKADQDWFSVTAPKPTTIERVVFAHGKSFHDGGWFDTEGGAKKPEIQVQTEAGGGWRTVATLDDYPKTTATDSAGLTIGQKFTAKFEPISVVAIRIIGKPACGDNPAQNFSSCAELQAYSSAQVAVISVVKTGNDWSPQGCRVAMETTATRRYGVWKRTA